MQTVKAGKDAANRDAARIVFMKKMATESSPKGAAAGIKDAGSVRNRADPQFAVSSLESLRRLAITADNRAAFAEDTEALGM